MVLIGLNGLRQIEPALAVVRSNSDDRISLLINGEIAAKAERGTKASEWAMATVRLINRARSTSVAMNKASAERIYATIFETLAYQLDSYTRYSTADAAREERARRDGFGGIGANIETHVDGALNDKVKPGQPADLVC